MLIRAATPEDTDGLWAIFAPIVRAGETYALDRDLDRQAALAFWFEADCVVQVAEEHGRIIGSYRLRPNQQGGGGHVCTCGYIVDAAASGRGVARRLHGHSVDEARRSGYRAMQFSFVVSTNHRAVRLWLDLGFAIVGRLPAAFRRPSDDFVDVLILFKQLCRSNALAERDRG